ncbi:HET-domain-containing protein [Lindgomyces ingoldianus]|uniref:HET-domain-containing protein n=1 Tax=Lindgomyces ingoldianus TaxID=673940 RepID=A0ACB6RBT3_9PLEO|nr:HET-domain-containing protein [Lindgomyces ingoldianus]KAF2475926.1 HET-domain-containing protein [Lindgomyces ingoldianus]
MKLCSVCSRIDVRALLLAAEAKTEGIPRFFQHLPDLPSLKASASRCDPCNSIWRSYCYNADPRHLTTDGLKAGPGMEQIWIGTTPYHPALHSLPFVAAFQYTNGGQQRTLAHFEVCAHRGAEPEDNRHLLAASIFPYSGSSECLTMCRKWLRGCCDNHKACKKSSPGSIQLPTRIIDVESSDINGTPQPRLVDGEQRHEAFAALSYCWGGERILTLTTETEEILRAGLPLERFPATLRDAIIVTQNLRIRYLWIDALCIQQDSTEDWTREAAKMRDVYKGAVVTIAAAASSRSSDGIFRDRALDSWACTVPWVNGQTPPQTVILRPAQEIYSDPARTSLMHTRGWTLQESLLAPRTIWLGAHLISFECANGQVDEAGRSTMSTQNYRSKAHIQAMRATMALRLIYKVNRMLNIPHIFSLYYPSLERMKDNGLQSLREFPRFGLQSFQQILTARRFFSQGLLKTPGGSLFSYYDLWCEIVTQYSTRDLTQLSDTLPALAGIANDFYHVTGDTYLAGMWKGDLMRSLCWTSRESNNRMTNIAEIEYLAPSWTWASLFGHPILFYGQMTETTEFKHQAKVHTIKVKTAGQDPFGKVTDGLLVLTAPFLPIEDPQQPALPTSKHPHLFERAQYIAKGSEFRRKHISHQGQRFCLVQLSTHKNYVWKEQFTAIVLLLESTADGKWRRVGYMSIRIYVSPLADYEQEGLKIEEKRGTEWKTAPWIKRKMSIV